ncbi:MAG TPA: hypothetical protein VN380_01225 [Thermoanaerobaculia bacterium]|jgi:hypothetical protein|nr:hypothetical protein [Thermoanaerobaculia bacterium]
MSVDDVICFDPDQPSGWSEADFTQFVVRGPWRVARTMPTNPHEYTLRDEHSDDAFDAAVRYIREHGRIEYYAAQPYKTIYCDDHKFWTMGAPLLETVLINRKQRMADASDAVQPRSDTGTRDESPVVKSTLQLMVIWSGPFTRESVISGFTDGGRSPEYDGEDYGLYQIYGKHILCGSDTLLYIGQATEQTFSRRFRQHERWLAYEEDISVYLGRVYDPNRHTAVDNFKGWAVDVRLAECLLIYKYSPNYNAVAISGPPPLGNFERIDILHEGERHKLHPRDSAPVDWG